MAASSATADAAELKQQQLALLLAPPSAAAAAAYYARLTDEGTPGHGRVTVGRAAHGKGLFAARDFVQGDRVLVEPPLIGMQQETNR